MTHVVLASEEVLCTHDVLSLKPFSLSRDTVDDSRNLIELLERHRTSLPFADSELVLYQKMRRELETYQGIIDHALVEWRAALTYRWECEVEGQRIYTRICEQLQNHFGVDAPHMQVVAPTYHEGASTAEDLLSDLRRLYATLKLIQTPLGQEYMHKLSGACDTLDGAITTTRYWEEQRRSAILSQRLVHEAYERASRKTKHMIVQHLGDYAA